MEKSIETAERVLVSTVTEQHDYIYASGKLLRETVTTTEGSTSTIQTLDFFYDASGTPYALKANGTTYYYVTNLQGDVVRLVNSSGTAVASYEYDPYGNIVSQSGDMAEINPLRYRSYYFDSESGFYYLQSRYYDPAIGRFINADDVSILGANESLLGYNLFAYCQNNPVNLTDGGGYLPSWATKVLIGTAVIVAAAVLTVATAGTGTALACFAVGALKGAVVGAAVGAASGAASGAISHRITTGSWEGAGEAALNGAADGYMSGAISGFVAGGLTSNVCFVAGTAVFAASGSVAIEEIAVGDYVWAWDEETGDVALKEVVETYVNETDELIHVFVNGEEIITTPSHPFYSPVKGWTDAVRLRAGDILVLVNGEYVVVEKVQHEILEAPVTVYNFQVEDYHTYYVTNTGVLVHNVCVKQSNPGASGQAHHPISRKIESVASQNPNLKGVVTRNNWGTIRAGTITDHLGYQKWHRNFDNATISWLNKHISATADEFIGFMNNLYSSTVATSKFGIVTFS